MAWSRWRKHATLPARRNPFFRTTASSGRAWLIGGGVTLLFALVGTVLYTPWFLRDELILAGLSPEREAVLRPFFTAWFKGRHALILPNRHRFFWSKATCEAGAYLPEALGFLVCDPDGNTLVLSAGERAEGYSFLWQDTLTALDLTGTLIGPVDDLERARRIAQPFRVEDPLWVTDMRTDYPNAAEAARSIHWTELRAFLRGVQTEAMLTVNAIRLEDDRIELQIQNGPALYLSQEKPVREQLDKLLALMRRGVVDLATLTYIDLRYTHRLYYH